MELETDFSIRPIRTEDYVKGFKTGHESFQPLKTFLNNQAVDFQQKLVAQTYVCVHLDNGADTGRVFAYMTLTCSEIDITNGIDMDDTPNAVRYNSMPALKIARLAVDSRHRKNGIGEQLVYIALSLAHDDIAPISGCRFLVTDAKPQAIDFYHRCGFTLLDTPENTNADCPVMFLDIYKNITSN